MFNVQALRACAASTCHLELERRNKSNCTHAPFLHSRPPLPEASAGWAPALAVRAELGPHRCGLCALHPGPSTLSRLSSPLSTEGGSLPRLCQATRQTREAAVPRQEGGGTGALAIEVETRMLEGAAARSELCLRFSEDPEEQRQM